MIAARVGRLMQTEVSRYGAPVPQAVFFHKKPEGYKEYLKYNLKLRPLKWDGMRRNVSPILPTVLLNSLLFGEHHQG